MNETTRKLMANIALTGWARVFSATEIKAAKDLSTTGLFTLSDRTVGGVTFQVLKLTTE